MNQHQENSLEITLIDPLTHNECLALEEEATNYGIPICSFHGKQNLMIRIEFDSDCQKENIMKQIKLIASWLNNVNGVGAIGRIRKIEDYYTNFISNEVKTLTKTTE
jgi:hypothetical protein